VRRRVAEAAEAMGGDVVAGDATVWWDGAAIDSRKIAGGELFFALEGERTDGHRFVGAAFEAGAAAAVVHQDVSVGDGAGAVIRVSDTYQALHTLTRAMRRQLPEVMVAITGSSGKTTTKELLARVCAERFRTARNPGNFNNLYGFPVSFLNVPDDTEVMVAELGMSSPGELGEVSRLAKPDGVALLNVRAVHLENFSSVAEIAEAKSEIFQGLPAGRGGTNGSAGFVAADRDDAEVVRVTRRWAAETGGRVIWFSAGLDREGHARAADDAPVAEVRARDARAALIPTGDGGELVYGTRFVLELGAGPAALSAAMSVEVELPLHGRYNVANAVAAAAMARELGMTPSEIAAGLAAAAPADHRGSVHRLAGRLRDAVLIDDSYNSNPDALALALAGAAELAEARANGGAAARRVAVVGDMLELGPDAPRFHRESGETAARLGFSPVAAVGELSRHLAEGARAGGAEVEWLPDAAAAAEWAEQALRPGDLVLVKASRGVGLDLVVERLLAEGGD
jgi:UDP-N-acetylmuramoyl-tripeptide--D-alanyl-D-alanine ligase